MFILVKDQLPLKEMDDCALVISIREDGKTFRIIRHPDSQICHTHHHISMLNHFILSVQGEENEKID